LSAARLGGYPEAWSECGIITPFHEQRAGESGVAQRDVSIGDIENRPVLQVDEVDHVAAEDPIEVVSDRPSRDEEERCDIQRDAPCRL
jgi:hypothetical protein